MRQAYTAMAPLYDALLERATRDMRRTSIRHLPAADRQQQVLLMGVGSGLDFPHLPPAHHYVGVDITPAMLRLARRRAGGLSLDLLEGDCQQLPFPEQSFDHVLAHLIVAVTPQPARTLAEAARVLRPGGHLLLVDKFLPPGRPAPLRRALNRFSAPLFTRLDVVLEPLLEGHPELSLEHDRPGLAFGWFRTILLRRQPGPHA